MERWWRGGGTQRDMDEETESTWDMVAESDTAVVVFEDALRRDEMDCRPADTLLPITLSETPRFAAAGRCGHPKISKDGAA